MRRSICHSPRNTVAIEKMMQKTNPPIQAPDSRNRKFSFGFLVVSGVDSFVIDMDHLWSGCISLRKAREDKKSARNCRCSLQASQIFRRSGVWIFGLFHNSCHTASAVQAFREHCTSAGTRSAETDPVCIKLPRRSGPFVIIVLLILIKICPRCRGFSGRRGRGRSCVIIYDVSDDDRLSVISVILCCGFDGGLLE